MEALLDEAILVGGDELVRQALRIGDTTNGEERFDANEGGLALECARWKLREVLGERQQRLLRVGAQRAACAHDLG